MKNDIDGLSQDHSNSSALAMKLVQSCTEPSIYISPYTDEAILFTPPHMLQHWALQTYNEQLTPIYDDATSICHIRRFSSDLKLNYKYAFCHNWKRFTTQYIIRSLVIKQIAQKYNVVSLTFTNVLIDPAMMKYRV